MKKMNNKGFSLVELIIVIAIMAILAAALAPQLIKYLEKSRESTDAQTCDTIKSAFNAALTNEAAYAEVVAGTGNFDLTDGTSISISGKTALEGELKDSLAQLKAPKASGKTKYTVSWDVSTDKKITNVKVVTA